MSIRNQVHATIIFISLLSFFVVGVATILFFIDRYNNNNREKLSRTIHVMQNEVRNSLSELIGDDDVMQKFMTMATVTKTGADHYKNIGSTCRRCKPVRPGW